MKKTKISWAKKSLCGRILCRVLGEEKGAVAMEYIVIALLVAAAVVGLVMVFSGSLRNMFATTNEVLNKNDVESINTVGDEHLKGQEEMTGQNKTAIEAGDKLGGDFSKQ